MEDAVAKIDVKDVFGFQITDPSSAPTQST